MNPSGWDKTALSNIVKIVDSLHKTPMFSDEGYPMVRVTDLKGGRLSLSDAAKVSQEVFEEFSRNHKPKRGDIIFSRVGSFGIPAYVDTDEPFCLGQNTIVISPFQNIDSKFLYNMFLSSGIQAEFFRTVDGSSQKTLSLKTIRSIEIPVPPKREQEKIAKILSTWDEAIVKVEALQSKIQMILDLTLLKLNTEIENSKYRTVKLGEVLSRLSNGMTYDTKESHENGIPITRIETISNGKIDLNRVGLVKPELVNEDFVMKNGDILLSHINSIDHIGKSAFFDGGIKLLHGMNLLLLRSNQDIDARFLFHVLHTQRAKRFFASHAKKAVNQASINTGELAGFSFCLPDKNRQLEISSQVDCILRVLDLLKLKVDFLKLQKNGLMQQLLTGKKRVKV